MGAVSQYLKVHSRFVTERNPESSPFVQEFRLCLVYSHPAKETSSGARPLQPELAGGCTVQFLTVGSMSCWPPAWAGDTGPPSAQLRAVAMHIPEGWDQSQVSATIGCRGGKNLFLSQKGTRAGRGVGAVAQTSISAGNLQLRLCFGDE